MAGHLRLLRRRPGGRPVRHPAAHPRNLGRGAFFALAFPLGYATIGLVLGLRRPAQHQFGLTGVAGTVAKVVGFTGLVVHTACLPAALLCVVLRFRTSRGVERQQLRWVAAGAAAAVIGILAGAAGVVLTYAAVLCVPVSVAVAVLRYRLWDLDRLVSRTVTYALVTTLLVAPYLLILPAVTRLGGDAGSLAVAATTLAAVALLAPLRRRPEPRCGCAPPR